ncbi:MAG: hypothetical protein QW279_01980 [Candidatus Jordarchaeaceae archaeon]
METEFTQIAKKIATFIPVKHYIAFLDNTGNILYSSLSNESKENIKKLAQILPLCDIGDFQVKKLKKANLILYKISPDIFLAIESYEKEGVIISAAKRLEEKYTEIFGSKKTPIPTPQIQAVSEIVKEENPGTEPVKEVLSTVETKISDPPIKGEAGLNEIIERLAKVDTQIREKRRRITSA